MTNERAQVRFDLKTRSVMTYGFGLTLVNITPESTDVSHFDARMKSDQSNYQTMG